MWSNKYIGIPYLDNGRTTAGTDCWGLVRLIYKEEFNIELPSFFSDYTISDIDRISELMSQYREGWEPLSLPEEGCVVLFNILGKASHIGIMINDRQFVHTRRNQEASIETLDSIKWTNRVAGFYKYNEKTSEYFKNIPTPLSATELTVVFDKEFTVGEAFDAAYLNAQIPDEIKERIILFVDGIQVFDNDQIIKEGQKLEYRIVPSGNDFGRVLTTLVVMYVAYQAGVWVGANAGFAGSATATAAATGNAAFASYVATAGTLMVGQALVNSIFPIRPPDPMIASGGMDSSNPQLLLNGARNEARQYEAVPVVLGTYKIVAPVAGINVMEVDTDTSYLRMLLCWGYGPVHIQDMRVGATRLSDYLTDPPTQYTVLDTSTASASELNQLYKIYGNDTTQLVPNLELLYTEPVFPATTQDPNADWITRTISNPCTHISVAIHFPQGLRGVNREGAEAGVYYAVPFTGQVQVRPLDPVTLTPTGAGTWITPALGFAAESLQLGYGVAKESLSLSINSPVWSYHSAYTNNIIYLTEAGDLGIATGLPYINISDTSTIVDGSLAVLYYSGHNSDIPVYSNTATYTTSTALTPTLPPNAKQLYRIVVWAGVVSSDSTKAMSPRIISTTDYRSINHITSGGDILTTSDSLVVDIAAGNTDITATTISYGLINQPFYLRKDAFTANIVFSTGSTIAVPYEVRVRRTNSDLFDFDTTLPDKPYYYNKSFLYMITGTNGQVPAVKPPTGVPFAMTALKIKATDQLNGSIEGINALVSSVCLDYENSTYSITTIPLTTISGSPIISITNPGYFIALANSLFVGSVISSHSGFSAPVTVVNISQTSLGITSIVVSAAASSSATDSIYTITTDTWVKRQTSNPASLFRYVLQHPANMQAISDADASTKLDLTGLQAWHTYCKTNNYMYNAVIVQHKSLLEVLRDISAVGRASPMLINGKWGVVIDQPRTTLVQHFTPHNSWGFEATRILSNPPHALRVGFISSYDEYQSHELTIYSYSSKKITITTTAGSTSASISSAVLPSSTTSYTVTAKVTAGTTIPVGTTITITSGSTAVTLSTSVGVTTGTASATINLPYTSDTATLFETIQLPGVTDEVTAKLHAQFHLAQAILRPETYSINTDMEHLVCNRGDLVRVTHDVPMWGMATGRIKNRIDANNLELSESILLEAGVSYTIRIRDAGGNSIVRTVASVGTTDYYTFITVTASLTSTEGAANNLFMLGTNNSESAEMVVISIEPSSNMTAKLSLVDYSPAIYTSDSDFSALPSFSTQITPAISFSRNYIKSVPVISDAAVRSDESVMEKSGNSFIFKISIPYTQSSYLEKIVTNVEYRLCLAKDLSKSWRTQGMVPVSAGSILISDVTVGLEYAFQLRYVSGSGFTGPWTAEHTHTITGGINPPGPVNGLTVVPDNTTGKLKCTWYANKEVDIKSYEVRTDTNWGNVTNRVFLGSATTCLATAPTPGASTTIYVKAIDYLNKYSITPVSVTYTTAAIPNIVLGTTTYSFYDTSAVSATITIDWVDVAPALGLRGYEITYDAVVKTITASAITLPANWTGTRNFVIKTVDINGNKSSGLTYPIVKSLPIAPASGAISPIAGAMKLDWVDSVKTSLPIWGYEVRNDTSFGSPNPIFKGTASVCNIPAAFITPGLNTFWIKAIDTDNNYSSDTLAPSYNVALPLGVSTITHAFADTSLTSATVTLDWNDVTPLFGLNYYEISDNLTSVVKTTKASTITLPANWLGDKIFKIAVVDLLGNKSAYTTRTINKAKPNPVTNFRAQVIDNNVMLFWDLPVVTTLPIDHVKLKRGPSGVTWAAATLIGDKKGGFTTQSEMQGGAYTYWIAVVDTDNNESDPVSLTCKVSEAPDFVFHQSFTSTFNAGTSVFNSAKLDINNTVVLPVNTTETFQDHFTTRSWTTPSAQVSAGYPIYIEPANGNGYYEETFDYGTVLNSSRITLSYNGSIISGSPTITTSIYTSSDNISYNVFNGVTSVYATSFRYVRVKVNINESTGTGLYALSYLNVTLDAKLLNDAGKLSAMSTDTLGTIVNFNKTFIDVSSITLSPSGTTAMTAVYDFNDNNIASTYSVTSNVCTVTATSHGFLPGQKVKLDFASGLGINGVYTITGYTSNTFTVAMTVANTSGTSSIYPQSFRVYVFDSTTGTRIPSTAVSWSAKGY